MATYPPFCTPAELAAWTQLPADDARLAGAVDSASAMIRAFCGWHLAPTLRETIIVDGPGGHVVSLPTMHVVEIFAIDETFPTFDPPVDIATLEWSRIGELRRVGGYWTTRYQGLQIDLEHGYPTGSAAWAIAHSVALSVASRAILSPVSGVVREQTLVSSITYGQSSAGISGGTALAPSEFDALSTYKLRTV